MSRRTALRDAALALAAGLPVLAFLLQYGGYGSGTHPGVVPPDLQPYVAALPKLLFLWLAFWLAGRSAAGFDAQNPIRPAWKLLSWGILSFAIGHTILAFHTLILGGFTPFPSLADLFPGLDERQRVYAGLRALTDDLLGRRYARQDTGEPAAVERCLIDARWQTDAVHHLCRQSAHAALLLAAKGYSTASSVRAMNDWQTKPGERVDYRGFEVEVMDAEKKRVNRVRFRRKLEEAS